MLPCRPERRLTFARVLVVLLAILWSARAVCDLGGRASGAAAGPASFARPEFEALWARTDAPVASGAAVRSWLWGPAPGVSLRETFAQAPDGTRLVQYFDKARMELNTAASDPADPWRVTTGLLVTEDDAGSREPGGHRGGCPVDP